MDNKLIVVEGACDSIGKSTQINKLIKRLELDGEKVLSHHFPSYNTDEGLLVEKYLRGDLGSISSLSPYLINTLYAVDRAITWKTKLKPQYEEGCNILLDRYTTSSLIYQSALLKSGEEIKRFIDYVCDYEYHKLEIKDPDEVIFLTAPFDLVMSLKSKRLVNDGVSDDIHERDLSFLRRVYNNANFIAKYLNWSIIQCNEDDKMRSIDDIHKEIYRLVRKK